MTFSKGMVGIAKTGVALLFIVFLFVLTFQFLTTQAVQFTPAPTIINFSQNSSLGARFNVTLLNSEVGDTSKIIQVNISYDPSILRFLNGTNSSFSNVTNVTFSSDTSVGVLSWSNTTVDGFINAGTNETFAFNFSLLSKIVSLRQINLTVRYQNQTTLQRPLNITVVDDVVPVVSNVYTNVTVLSGSMPLVTPNQTFSLNVTAVDHNMTFVRLFNVSSVNATNESTGRWAINTTATTLGCTRTDGVQNNCLITANASDGANFATATLYIAVDSQVPAVILVSPTAGNITNTSSRVVNFNVTVLEPNPAASIVEVTQLVSGNGTSVVNNYSLVNLSTGNWGYTNTSMADGTYLVRFYVNDTLGNINASVMVNFSVSLDSQVPNVVFVSINDSIVRSTQIINAQINVTDTNRVDSQVNVTAGFNSSMSLVSGNTFQTNSTFTPQSVGCSNNPTMNCTLRFSASDATGNTNNSVFYNITIDDVAPNVTATSMNDADTVVRATQSFTMNATILENKQLASVNFSNVNTFAATNLSNGAWTLVGTSASALGCTTSDGVCRIYVNATDEAGNTNNSVFLNVTVDEARPNVTLVGPANGNSSISASVTFSVSVLERNPANTSVAVVQITPSGQSATNYSLLNTSGVWAFTNSSMPDGVYTAQFFIIDAVSLENNSVTTTFAVDTVKPSVSGAAVDDNIVSSTQIMQVNVTVTDTNRVDSQVNVTAGGYNSSMSLLSGTTSTFQTNATFTAQSVGCTAGNVVTCTLRFSAADAGGNVNNSVYKNITVDDDTPNVTITSPSNATIQTNTVSFNVTVEEQNAANASVPVVQITPTSAGQSATNYSLFNNSGSWTFTNSSMPTGTYTAQFFIPDAANNINNSRYVNFTVDAGGPTGTIDVITPNATNGGVVYLARNVTINVTASDSNGVKNINVLFQSGSSNTTILNNLTALNNTQAFFMINTSSIPDGTYNITVNATDGLGNTNHNVARQQVVVDNSKPVLLSWSYSYISKNITLNFSDIIDTNSFSVTAIAVKSNDGTNVVNLTTAGTTKPLVNSTSVNITLKSILYDNLETITNTPWKLDALANTFKNILGENNSLISDQNVLNATDYAFRFPTRPSVWTAGWRDFFVNQVSPGLQDAQSLAGNYSVTNVLTSVANNYDIIYYQSGSTFTSYVPGRPTNDFTTFASNTSTDRYWIHMNATDAIEIA